MRRHVATFVAAALLLASVAGPVTAGAGPRAADAVSGGVATTAASADPADPTGRWIVLYKGGTDARVGDASCGPPAAASTPIARSPTGSTASRPG